MRKILKNLGDFVRIATIGGAVALAPYIAKADVTVEPKDSTQTQSLARWERGKMYTVNVWAQNNDTQSIHGGQWNLTVPSELQSYLDNISFPRPPAETDFFSGDPMFWENYNSSGNLSIAILDSSGDNVPQGGQGFLQRYDFNVHNLTPLGPLNFSLSENTAFLDNDTNPILATPNYSQQFRIMPRKGDVNGDGVKDIADIQRFANILLGTDSSQLPSESYAGEYADWSGNDDGQKDGRDIQNFVRNYLAP